MCNVLQVSSSGYYNWRTRSASKREMANKILLEQIKIAHKDSYETYGSPRIHKELQENGVACSENRVARLMQAHDIQAKQSNKRKMTTKANKNHPKTSNLLDRAFTATRPNEKWTTDITYIWTAEGWLYLAIINLPKKHFMLSSMSRTGNCWDNAASESLFGTVKTELIHHRSYETRNEAKSDIFFYLESFYNRRRRHSTLGYVSPMAYETTFYNHQTALTLSP